MQRNLRWLSCAVALLALSLPADVFACSCRPITPEENLKTASAVFWGKVKDVTVDGGRRQATFDVGKWFKGAKQKTVKVTTNVGGTACGVSFRTGDAYLVFAYERNGSYGTSSCSNTRQMRQKPTSATKPPDERNLSRQKKVLDPVLRPIAEKAAKKCKAGSAFKLTFYDNGEFDLRRPSECWDKHFAPTFKVPKLPSGYPFTVYVRLRRDGEVSLNYEDDGRSPLLRGAMHEQLTWRLPPVRREEQLIQYRLTAANGRLSRRVVGSMCRLAGPEATRRFLKKSSDKDAERYLSESKTFYDCAVQRRDWRAAATLVTQLKDYVAGPVERTVRAETAKLKGRPKLADLSVSASDILSLARTKHGWADDVVLLQLIAEALLAQPTPAPGDRELAAMAYARAAYLHDPVNAELTKLAIELAGESVVDEMEERARQQGLERAKKRLEKLEAEGKTAPPLPK